MNGAVESNPGTQDERVRFFAGNKFSLGLFSFLYVTAILVSLATAILLPLIKGGRFRLGEFFLLAIPAWALIAIVIAGLEGGQWFLFPHWFWTACKSVRIVRRTLGPLTSRSR